MRQIFILCVCVFFVAQVGYAQMSVNPNWGERNGLTVASSQTILVPAKTLRCFTTLESIDAEPRTAVANLNAKKKSALDALKKSGFPEDAIRFTSTKILEWETPPKSWILYRSNTTAMSPKTDLEQYTAFAHLSFDVPLAGIDPDELAILPHDICKRLREQPAFDTCQIVLLFIGEVEESQVNDATKKAYDEAHANAKSIASLAGRSLGQLAALTPEMDGRWRYWSDLSYDFWTDETGGKNPLSSFRPAENEVFGNDASMLSRTYSVELRFNIE